MHAPVAIDGYCGAGGLSLGLKQAGFDIAAAYDYDAAAILTYRANLGPEGFIADATRLSAAELTERAGCPGTLDLIAAGPPCQGFSKQKRGAHLGDNRNDHVVIYSRLIRALTPKMFILENVDMLGGKRGRDFVAAVRELLGDYDLVPHLYNSADYGLAQTRPRFIIVGKHKDLRVPFAPPQSTHPRHTWTTVGEALAGLPEPPADYTEHESFANHYAAKVTAINVERFSHVPQGGGWQDIPADLRLPCHKAVDVSSGGWPDVYGRLRADGQAPTITGGFDSYTRGRYGHPYAHRPLTPREAARLQGFPDSFRFYGTRHEVRHQIGNAVPPPLAKAIGTAILRCLNQIEPPDLLEHWGLSERDNTLQVAQK